MALKSEVPLLRDILAEPASLAQTLDHQYGPGRKALLDAALAIRKAGLVYITGMGGSFTPAIQLSYQLGAAGVPALAIETGELLHYLSPLARNAVVIVISRSGDTIETTKLLPILKAQGATIIGITNETASTLAREAGHVLYMNSLADTSVALQTYVCTVATLLLLGAAVLEQPLDAIRAQFDALVASLERALPGMLDASESWRSFLAPESQHAIYLLGRGPSYGSAVEGGIMLNEMSKKSAVGVSAGNFRHGSVEMIDADFRAIVFATQPRTRAMDLSLAAQMQSFGGQVRIIGAPDSWPIPECAELLTPIAEIVPVHLAGYRLASWRNLPLGEFRFISLVTKSEETLG